MIQLPYRTWRYLGLGVAVGYAGLGLFASLAPQRAAKEYFGIEPSKPKANTTPKISGNTPTASLSAAESGRTEDESKSDLAVKTVLPLMGARDLSIFTALMIFFHRRQHSEMGVVILSGMVLCTADIVMVWARKGAAV